MEKRIKTVWILTIITAILIIGGQGYWLHHQYCYSTRTFMQELHKQILQLEKEEMNTRYDKRTNNHKYTLSYKIEMPDSVNQNGKTTCVISFYRQKSEINNLDSLIKQNALLNEESVIVRDSFRVENISNEILFDAATVCYADAECKCSVCTVPTIQCRCKPIDAGRKYRPCA